MLEPGAAKQELAQWQREVLGDFDLVDHYIAAARKLPARLRGVAWFLLGRDSNGDHLQRAARQNLGEKQAVAQLSILDGLAPRDRVKVFATLFGPLAADIELAWQALKSSTYSASYERTMFRAPSSPERTLRVRHEWLNGLFEATGSFRFETLTPAWLAAWAPYIIPSYYSREKEIGLLLAAVIDQGGERGDEVFEILSQSARREHEIGAMGRHVTVGLLAASRTDGWETIEKMLLAAQRQEGVRQVIFESLTHARPQAFRRMLAVIADHRLARFSSVAQAVDRWFAFHWAASATDPLHATIATVADLLAGPSQRQAALAGDDPEAAYLALWSIAFEDAVASVTAASQLLDDPRVELRFVAALHLAYLRHDAATPLRLAALDDEDLRVALAALSGHNDFIYDIDAIEGPGTFEALERLTTRLPNEPATLKALVWPWTERLVYRDLIDFHLVDAAADRPTALIPHLASLSPYQRQAAAGLLAAEDNWDAETRATMLRLAGDVAKDVRKVAIQALHDKKIAPADTEVLEAYLTRKAADLRAGVISLVLTLEDQDALASAERLLASTKQPQRHAGLEILRGMAEADRARESCVAAAAAWLDGRKKILPAEQTQVDAILGATRPGFTLADALGSMNPDGRSRVASPEDRGAVCVTATTVRILSSLDDLIHAHREQTVRFKRWGNEEREELLGEIEYGFPTPSVFVPIGKQLANLPLHDVWVDWLDQRPDALRDPDGFEIVRAKQLLAVVVHDDDELRAWAKKGTGRGAARDLLTGGDGAAKLPKLRYPDLVEDVLRWLSLIARPVGVLSFAMDVVETFLARLPDEAIRAAALRDRDGNDYDAWVEDYHNLLGSWEQAVGGLFNSPDSVPSKQEWARYWRLLRFIDEPFDGAPRTRPPLPALIGAFESGCATLDDVADHLPVSLAELTVRRPSRRARAFVEREEIADLLRRCTERVLEIELTRGESETVATEFAVSIGCYRGIDKLVALMSALGKNGFKKVPAWHQARETKAATLTAMIERTWPGVGETADQFAREMRAAMREGHVTEERLVQLVFLAPQWVGFLETTLEWPGLAEAVYWYLAHMRYVWGLEEMFETDEGVEDEDAAYSDEPQPRRLSRWERIIRERTDLTDQERSAGAIDVAWFHQTYAVLGAERWAALAAAARYAGTPAQAKRARFIGDVLLGEVTVQDLVDGIRTKKLKEYVRLLGLLPLAKGTKRQADLLGRYEVLQEYRKYAGTLSSMTRPEALLACEIGLQNLASTAGYADPLRLQWAMEARSTADLAKGPVVATKGDVTLTLELDDQAVPDLTVRRAQRVLKSVPKDVRKNTEFVALRERHKHLAHQASRVRQSLEAAMCRGDAFTGAELMQLADHALLWPQLSRLILVGEAVLGYPVKGGRALRNYDGDLEPVGKKDVLRVAHPYDLLREKAWSKWQRECFARERMQPFKQVFRELYVVTGQEKKDKTVSRRYSGQQVQPRQARALWGRCDWSVDEYGEVFKAFPYAGITATVSFDHGYTTPLEYEDTTIDGVGFVRTAGLEKLLLVDVPPRLFSEVMRDMDLVVSVAHAGAVDPEASASTVEMRRALLAETCQLLRLSNVKLRGDRAIVKGQLGEYTIHLGSGVVHRMPGGSVCIVPVHSQHRGRLFLPFADDDPRTAEVVSKTLLLARDHEIDDPIILEQLRAMA